MEAPLPAAHVVSARPRPLGFELALVVLVALAILVPGIWRYTLVDPWETHYGEVAREMLENHDLVRTTWRGTMSGEPNDNEGFRSKPVLQFWAMAAGLKAVGVDDGGYSGEMVDSPKIMFGIRIPFVLGAVFGLALLWWMLARLLSRRLAWLGLLTVGSAPMYAMISRNAMPDMLMVACSIGSIALFTLAVEDGERPILPLTHVGRRRIPLDARHVMLGLVGGVVVLQAAYYVVYFLSSPQLAVRGVRITPAIWLPGLMLLGLVSMWHRPWTSAFGWAWRRRGGTDVVARLLGVAPLTTMRQVYLLGCYSLLGLSLLAKGPPGFTVVGGVGALHVLLLGRWRALYEGAFELKRGLILIAITAVPWHVAMYLKDGLRFIDEYLITHVLNRAAVGVDNSPGTFEYYTNIVGHGMWLWAALLPAALAAAFFRARLDTREGRVRFMMLLWAIVAFALFSLVQTKFHHYILPAVPPLALLVAFLLDDIASGRERLHPLYAMLGVAIVLLVCRDLMHEPERWIEMFVFRYDRPWPSAEPWSVDPSDGFLVLGLAGAVAIPLLATRWVRLGTLAVGAVGLAICVWALQVYMPHAGTHWGMRDAARTYYEQRSIYGQKVVYFTPQQLRADWAGAGETWSFETMIPDSLQVGQPMTITVELRKDDERVTDQQLTLVGTATAIGDHRVTVTLAPGERARLAPLIARAADATAAQKARAARGGRPPSPPIRAVDADRLIGWQLYWRGENFWSGGEIWGVIPENKTQFNKTDNVEFNKYLGDRTRAPLGRRYFVITEASRLQGLKSLLPTPRARDTFEILDTTSNKFSIGSFTL